MEAKPQAKLKRLSEPFPAQHTRPTIRFKAITGVDGLSACSTTVLSRSLKIIAHREPGLRVAADGWPCARSSTGIFYDGMISIQPELRYKMHLVSVKLNLEHADKRFWLFS